MMMIQMSMKSVSQAEYMSWSHRSDRLEHEYAITAWAISWVPEICNDIFERWNGDMREN